MIQIPDWGVIVAVGIQALIVAASWGDIKASLRSIRETGNDRHKENRETLRDIQTDIKRINGRVNRHDAEIEALQQEDRDG